MSGIFGLFNRNGRPVEPAALRSMGEAMDSWGPDGQRLWCRGPVGLGHLLLKNTPESASEVQPLESSESGVVLSAAARIDNREELGQQLGMSPTEISRSPDSGLILKSYERWGKECVDRLLGDWSFGLWDPRQQRLFLARDHCGISGVYYYQDEHLFAFASSLKGLLALPQVPRRPNQMRLVRLVTVWMEGMNFGDTFYQDIQRLAAAHRVWVEPARSRLEEYWSLDNIPEIRLGRDEEYAEAFLEMYGAAVHCRLRTDRKVGIFLSSGLDSGSVAALAAPELARRNQRLQGFTSVPVHDTAFGGAGNEGPLAESNARFIGSVDVHPVRAEGLSPWNGVLRVLEILQEPAHATANYYWYLRILEKARERNIGVMLTGQMGNLTVSWSGYKDHVRGLLRSGQLKRYWHEIRAWKKVNTAPLSQMLRNQVVRPGLPVWLLRLVNRARSREVGPLLFLNPELALQLGLRQQMRASGHDPTWARSDTLLLRRLMLMHSMPKANQFELGAAHGLEIRDPTEDRRVVEFCLGTPDSQFHGNGRDRLLLRRAFSDLLPEAVLGSLQRGVQAGDVTARLVQDVPALQEILVDLRKCPEAAEFLDLPRMMRLVAKVGVASGRSRLTPNALLKGFMAGVFLMRFTGQRSAGK